MRTTTIILSLLSITALLGFETKVKTQKKIVLDPRFSFTKALQAEDYAFKTFEIIKEKLTTAGYLVYTTAREKETVNLDQRINFVNRQEADLYLSLFFYNLDQTKYGRKLQKDNTGRMIIYPIVKKDGFNQIEKARQMAFELDSQIKNVSATDPRIFNNSLVYDIGCPGLLLSINYKPETALHQEIGSQEFREKLADAFIKAIEEYFTQ